MRGKLRAVVNNTKERLEFFDIRRGRPVEYLSNSTWYWLYSSSGNHISKNAQLFRQELRLLSISIELIVS